jgi:hypothetical protein
VTEGADGAQAPVSEIPVRSDEPSFIQHTDSNAEESLPEPHVASAQDGNSADTASAEESDGIEKSEGTVPHEDHGVEADRGISETAQVDGVDQSNPGKVPENEQPAMDHDQPNTLDLRLAELNAEVEEFNRSVEAFQGRLADEPAPRPFHIARWLNALADLSTQRHDIASRIQDLPEADRESVTELLPIEPAGGVLRTKIDEVRTRLREGSFPGSDEDRQKTLELINVLGRQMSHLDTGR